MKKIFRFLLALVLTAFSFSVFGGATTAFATTLDAGLAEDNSVIGKIVNNATGESRPLYGRLIPSIESFDSSADAEIRRIIEFTVYSSNLSTTVDEADSSRSIRGYLTTYYKRDVEIDDDALLTRVSGYWERSDGNVNVSSALLRYGCSNFFEPQTGETYVNNNFNLNTGFTKSAHNVPGSSTGANLTLTIVRIPTGTTWTLFIENNLFVNSLDIG